MWAIFNHHKLRHCFGGVSGNPIALCGIEGDWPLDYARGAGNKKCQACTERLGRKRKVEKEAPNVESGNIPNYRLTIE